MTLDQTLLFVNPAQIDAEIQAHLGQDVVVHPYDAFFAYLKEFGADISMNKGQVRPSQLIHDDLRTYA